VDDDADFVFEPTSWDLAMSIGLVVDEERERAALDELSDAMLVWAEGPEVDRLTDEAVERIWSAELEESIRDGLLGLAAGEAEWRAAATAALIEFDRCPRRSEVARAVVQRLAMDVSQRDHPPLFCVCCLDLEVAAAPREERRALALRIAIVARRDAGVSDAELRSALAGAVSRSVVEGVGSAERRAAVRRRLGRIGRLGAQSVEALATELQAIAREPLPRTAGEDDVWNAVCEELLADIALPELN
jgi:hypothetical protein